MMNVKISHDRTGGFVAYGHNGTTMVVWSNPLEQIVELPPSNLTKHYLAAVCGPAWVLEHYFKWIKNERVPDWTALADAIVTQCQHIGAYDPNLVRGPGIWRHGADPEVLIVNDNELWRSDGSAISRTGSDDGYLYARGPSVGIEKTTPCACIDDIDCIAEAVESMNFQRPTDSRFVLGWLVAAVVPGALARRPHLIITGRRGSGKSSLLRLLAVLLGQGALEADGRTSTAAGLRQALRGQARALVLDEAEGEHASMQAIIELLRSAYSDHAGGYKGTVAGQAIHFQLSALAVLGMINEPRLEPADRTRIVCIDLEKLEPGKATPALIEALDLDGTAQQLGKRFRRLVVSLWPELRHNIDVMRRVVRALGREPRAADTIGVLLGGYATLIEQRQLDDEEARAIVCTTDLSRIDEAHGMSDESDALEMLLDARTTIGTSRPTVREAVMCALEESKRSRRKVFDEQLRRYGIRVDAKRRRLIVASSPNHPGLREIYRDTKLASGGWGGQLNRLDGATKSALPIQRGEKARAVVCIPLPEEMLVATSMHLEAVENEAYEAMPHKS